MTVAAAAETFKVAISSLFLGFFVLTPLKGRFRYSHLKTGIFFSAFVVLSMVLAFSVLALKGGYPRYKVLATLLWITYTVLLFHIVIRANRLEGLFVVLTAMNLYVDIVTVIRLVSVGDVFTAEVKMPVTAGILIMYIPLLWIMMLKLYRAVISFPFDIPVWRMAWIVPAFTFAIFYLRIVRNFWYAPRQADVKDVAFGILWALGTCIFLCMEFLLMIVVHKRAAAREQDKIIRERLRMQEEQYGQLLYNVRRSARLTHDWRHQLLVISGLAKEESFKELNQYLEELMPVCLDEADPPVCENHVVDIILRHYRGRAKAEGIAVEINAGIPSALDTADMDLSIVFGNLLENALDACTRQKAGRKFIRVKAAMKEESLVIIAVNSYDVNTATDRTVAVSCGGTGIGLLSVREVVERKKGFMEVKQEGGCFHVNIMIRTDAC